MEDDIFKIFQNIKLILQMETRMNELENMVSALKQSFSQMRLVLNDL